MKIPADPITLTGALSAPKLHQAALQGRQDTALRHGRQACKGGLGLQFFQGHLQQEFGDTLVGKGICHGVDAGKIQHDLLPTLQKRAEVSPDPGTQEPCPHTVAVVGKLEHPHNHSCRSARRSVAKIAPLGE